MMSWKSVEENWKFFKEKIQEKWGSLSDDELHRVAGRRDRLEAIIEQAYGVDKCQVTQDVDRWLASQRLLDSVD